MMTRQEAADFAQNPLCDLSLRMRQWDEQAKQVHIPVIDLQLLRNKAQHLLSRSVIDTTTPGA